MIPFCFFTLGLLHCKNIELDDYLPDKDTLKLYHRHFNKPMTKYKTLRIKNVGKHSGMSLSNSNQALMPLHMRRGNFATYTEEAPLFGKYTGTFWRPATAVGSEKNGVVVKDYEVEAPKI